MPMVHSAEARSGHLRPQCFLPLPPWLRLSAGFVGTERRLGEVNMNNFHCMAQVILARFARITEDKRG